MRDEKEDGWAAFFAAIAGGSVDGTGREPYWVALRRDGAKPCFSCCEEESVELRDMGGADYGGRWWSNESQGTLAVVGGTRGKNRFTGSENERSEECCNVWT